ncbi:TPA: AAA family ATPase [Yersinia enterocolitica]|nr:AAA family ATPase [Yersinia enterocolitica]
MNETELIRDIRAIRKSFEKKEFEPYIAHIRFPFFKNLAIDSRIDFNFPITVLVGKNGTNKSSVIKALYGSPANRSITKFWFSTELDTVENLEAEDGIIKHRYIYGYHDPISKRMAEVLQTRVDATKQTVDYWETSRPLTRDNMEPMSVKVISSNRVTTRWKKLKKSLVYIDFRSEISAFDRFMYHSEFKRINGKTKQDHLRFRTTFVRKVIDGNLQTLKPFKGKIEQIIKNIKLTEDEIKTVSFILNKEYQDISFIEHRLFDIRGGTAILKTRKLNYSEAFAGSGEFAIVSLVLSISRAQPASLILLDEPEVSLHPGAQKRLMAFIFKQVNDHKHQVIISTHSTSIVSLLPKEAIKLFSYDELSEETKIIQDISSSEAFYELGDNIEKIRIITEDKLAVSVVKRALSSDEHLSKKFSINYLPGGSESILTKYLPSFALSDSSSILVFLDGDKNTNINIANGCDIGDSNLSKEFKKSYGCTISIPVSGKDGVKNINEQNKAIRKVIDYYKKVVKYLPFNTPEEFIISNLKPEYIDILNEKKWDENKKEVCKEKIEYICKRKFDRTDLVASEIFMFQQILLADISVDNVFFEEIRNEMRTIVLNGII